MIYLGERQHSLVGSERLICNSLFLIAEFQDRSGVAARTGSNAISAFRKSARFRRKLAGISALTAIARNGHLAGIAQINALRLSDFFLNEKEWGHTG
jgi:hypothetical protein